MDLADKAATESFDENPSYRHHALQTLSHPKQQTDYSRVATYNHTLEDSGIINVKTNTQLLDSDGSSIGPILTGNHNIVELYGSKESKNEMMLPVLATSLPEAKKLVESPKPRKIYTLKDLEPSVSSAERPKKINLNLENINLEDHQYDPGDNKSEQKVREQQSSIQPDEDKESVAKSLNVSPTNKLRDANNQKNKVRFRGEISDS